MVFIHDTREALLTAADLVNTSPDTDIEGIDRLVNAEELTAFLRAHPYSGDIRYDEEELRSLRVVRQRLHQFWGVDRTGAVDLVNRMLADGQARPRLVIHDDYDWHIHATDDTDELATRIMVEVAMAMVDVIRADEYARLRVCEADDCAGVYVDMSRNGSKRYCDSGNCGNRMNVIAYRQRKAEENAE